jgi:hypothetical protein
VGRARPGQLGGPVGLAPLGGPQGLGWIKEVFENPSRSVEASRGNVSISLSR